jgi:hypothetical protein
LSSVVLTLVGLALYALAGSRKARSHLVSQGDA